MLYLLLIVKNKRIFLQIASFTPNSITPFISDFDASDYAFVGDIHQVCHNYLNTSTTFTHNTFHKLIPFEGDANMETNPYITITGNVTKFDIDDRSFNMTPSQYIILTHTTSPFPIHANFADSGSKKRWGAEGPKVAIGSTITLAGSLQRVVRERNIDRPLQCAQVEVTNIAYLGSARGPIATSQIRKPHSSFLLTTHPKQLNVSKNREWKSQD